MSKDIEKDFLEILDLPKSKKTVDSLLTFINAHPHYIEVLVEQLNNKSKNNAELSAWAISYLGETRPLELKPCMSQLIHVLEHTSNSSIRRNILRCFEYLPVYDQLEGLLFNTCSKYILDFNQPIAIRAFSIGICLKIIKKHQELINEFEAIIDSLENNLSPGLISRVHKVKRYLNKVL
jgi:hypothetical protein